MLFKSQVYTQASGSIGGITYSHNRGGMYTRGRAMPVNPNTTRQQTIRSVMGALVSAWNNTLTAAQRNGWNVYASNVLVTNRLGDQVNLSGINQYIRSNSIRLQRGVTRVDTAPSMNDTGEPVTGVNTVAIAADVLTFNSELAVPASDDGDVYVFIGKNINAGIGFYKGPYQALDPASPPIAVAAAATTVACGGDMTSIDYPHAAGGTMPLRIVIAYDDGRVTQAFSEITFPA